MSQAIENIKENYYRKKITRNLLMANSDRERSFIRMVVCWRQEQLPGSFLLLNRYQPGSIIGGDLSSSSYYLIIPEGGIIFLC